MDRFINLKIKILSILFLTISNQLFSQNEPKKIAYLKIIDGDTLYVLPLEEIEIKANQIKGKKKLIRRTNRLIRYVKKVYPYAKLAGRKLQEYDSILHTVDTDTEKRKLMRQAEKEINEEYGSELRNLTYTQGKILLKLIDRETGNTSYELVKDLRGGFTAFFYQTFARLFGLNLKVKYDPLGEDEQIEQIVLLIEAGEL